MGRAKAFVKLASGIDADLLVVPEESWGSALQYFTGSKEHSVQSGKIAISKGLRLNEWGVFKGDKRCRKDRRGSIQNTRLTVDPARCERTP